MATKKNDSVKIEIGKYFVMKKSTEMLYYLMLYVGLMVFAEMRCVVLVNYEFILQSNV